jgi:transglutaminase/protease-like cytokinesis protein 3
MLLVATKYFTGNQADITPSYPIQRTVKYSFTVKNPNNHPVELAELQVISPVQLSPFQKMGSINTSHPFETMEDHQGTKRMAFSIRDLPPFGSRNISITTSVELSERGHPIDSIQSEDFLQEERLIQFSHPAIQRIAKRLKTDEPRKTVEKTYNWIVTNVKKSGYTRDDLGAVKALKNKSGDCTEFMYLFSALARANGIPTRNVAGFVARENRIVRPADYHNWNEAYVDGAWYLIDTDRGVLMEKSSEYIAMRFISENKGNHDWDSQNFFSSPSDVTITMN